jgi:hypothetical protein
MSPPFSGGLIRARQIGRPRPFFIDRVVRLGSSRQICPTAEANLQPRQGETKFPWPDYVKGR